jgi:hypothetical protein
MVRPVSMADHAPTPHVPKRAEKSWIGSPFHENGELLRLFVSTQLRTENRFALFQELL